MNSPNETELFESVWGRVSSGEKQPAAGQGTASGSPGLEEYMDNEASDAAYHLVLASTTRDAGIARLLRSIARDERGHLQRLQTMYFLQNGDTYVPLVKPVIRPTNMLQALRGRYWAELEGQKTYQNAAASANAADAAVFIAMAADEAGHAASIAQIINGLLK